jgi:hypothetical protein
MKVAELRERVLAAGGELKFESLVFTYEKERDLDINANDTLIAWITKGTKDDEDVVKAISTSGELENVASLAELAQYIGLPVGEIKAITVTREVPARDDEKLRLEGKVEAYENILIGRGISASK